MNPKGDTDMSGGKVYLVGAGPGDARLMTVYGMECIRKSDVIAYDRLVNIELLDYAREDAERVYCGKLPGKHALIQEKINSLLIEQAKKGKVITRLKGGDPFVFGRGGEEADILAQNGIPYEIVPGVTSGIAVPAYAGIPVTHRNHASSFTIVTGHGRKEKGQDHLNWDALAKGSDTIVFYMGVGNLSYICSQLIKNGKSQHTSVAVIQWGTTERQRTVVGDLTSIEEKVKAAEITHPAIVCVGEVVHLREKIKWFQESEDRVLNLT